MTTATDHTRNGGDPLGGRLADAVAARDLTQAFLVRHGPTLIDPDRVGSRRESVARFRHDLRAKLSLFDSIVGSLDEADGERRAILSQIETEPFDEDRNSLRRQLDRCEETIASGCENVPDVIDEFLPEAPDIDPALTEGYRAFLDQLRGLRAHLLDLDGEDGGAG